MDRIPELYSRIRRRAGEVLPIQGMAETVALSCYERAVRLDKYLALRADRMAEECHMCDKLARRSIESEVYDSPFDTKGRILHFCSEECQEHSEDSYYTDFNYEMCDGCYRYVCARNPANGWHTHFRIDNDCEKYCLKCYESHILANGIDKEQFEEGQIPGMFFSRGNVEAIEAGYNEVRGYVNILIRSQDSIDSYCDRALLLIDAGYKIINCYESMAIGGLEGYVTMMAKKGKRVMAYRVFTRTWWINNPAWPNSLEPRAGRKTTIAKVATEDEARELCDEYNRKHKPGRLSRKAEFEEIW